MIVAVVSYDVHLSRKSVIMDILLDAEKPSARNLTPIHLTFNVAFAVVTTYALPEMPALSPPVV